MELRHGPFAREEERKTWAFLSGYLILFLVCKMRTMEVWQGNLASCNYYAIKPGFSISYHCKYPVKLIALATQVLNQLKEAITVQKIIEDEGFPLSFSFPGILRMRRNKR